MFKGSNPFAQIADTEVMAPNRLDDHALDYLVQVVKVVVKKSENPKQRGVHVVACEFKVVKVTTGQLKAGDRANYARYLDNDFNLREVKGMFAVLLDSDVSEVTAEAIQAACEDDGACLEGVCVRVYTVPRTSDDGTVYHNPRWESIASA